MAHSRLARTLGVVAALVAALLAPVASAQAIVFGSATWSVTGVTTAGVATLSFSGSPGSTPQYSFYELRLVIDSQFVDTVYCDAGTTSCSGTFTWNTANLPSSVHQVYAAVLFHDSLGNPVFMQSTVYRVNTPLAPTPGTTPPGTPLPPPLPPTPVLVTMTLPGGATNLSGNVEVDWTASFGTPTGAPQAYLTKTQVFLIGSGGSSTIIGQSNCGYTLTCSGSLEVPTYGFNGPATLSVEQSTDGIGWGVASQPVTVTNVMPTMTLTSPSAGDTLASLATVAVTGVASTPAGSTDYPASVTLLIRGQPVGTPFTCPGTTSSCPATVAWVTPFLEFGGDTSQLQLKMTTAAGNFAFSPVVSVAVATYNWTPTPAPAPAPAPPTTPPSTPTFSATRTTVVLRSPAAPGRPVAVTGTVRRTTDHRGVAGLQVRITATPAVGTKVTRTALTRADGTFVSSLPLLVNATLTAVMSADATDGASSVTIKAVVPATVSCRVSSATAKAWSDNDRLTCTVPRLSRGTKVTVRMSDSCCEQDTALRATGPVVRAALPVATRTVRVQLLVPATRVNGAGHSTALTVRVRG